MADAPHTQVSPTGFEGWVREGADIYAKSFAMIRAEADLTRFEGALEQVVVRMIHACGMVDLAVDVAATATVADAGRAALAGGAPIVVDAQMVARGVTRTRLPAGNEVVCTLDHADVRAKAADERTTRSAAAVDLWLPHLDGAVVAIGNAPTALFRLLELLADPATPRPAAIVGVPVGFVGAAEAKALLSSGICDVPWLTVRGRRGGSAIASGALNALANMVE